MLRVDCAGISSAVRMLRGDLLPQRLCCAGTTSVAFMLRGDYAYVARRFLSQGLCRTEIQRSSLTIIALAEG